MRVLVTGANGFIGKNIVHMLTEQSFEIFKYCRDNSYDDLKQYVENSDAVIHLAGENRPSDIAEFELTNHFLTKVLCEYMLDSKKKIPLILASSAQVDIDNPYGNSKLAAENEAQQLASKLDNSVYIYRLPGVFGKWSRPNYNSVVATFCHNIANDLPIYIDDMSKELTLVYIDDVIDEFIGALTIRKKGISQLTIHPEYKITLGDLAGLIKSFRHSRNNLTIERVGKDFIRALYSTYLSYLRPEQFSYSLLPHVDKRGVFVEVIKTIDSGQFSFFTVSPGATRGGHYHHTKTEKFVVIRGKAHFIFRNILTDEVYEIYNEEDRYMVVESVPGWSHNIKNVGNYNLIVLLWANEVFNQNKPDTFLAQV